MKFTPLPIDGAWLFEPELLADERGFFTRLMDCDEFAAHGLIMQFSQVSMSHNRHRGTLRGMHFQAAPHGEVKIVRVTAGSLYDVLIDIRPSSKTYLTHWAGKLSSENRHQLYIPSGVAHGFQTLENGTEVSYHMDAAFAPLAARGFAWNDPQFDVPWPVANPILSPKDAEAPNFTPALLA